MEAAGTIKNFLWTGRIEQRRKLCKALFYKEKRGKRTNSEAMESVAGVPASTEKHIDKIGNEGYDSAIGFEQEVQTMRKHRTAG